MDVVDAIRTRRAYRSLKGVEITETIIRELGIAAQLMPSCFNKQPWRFIFVYEKHQLDELKTRSLSDKNQIWAVPASMIIVVYAKRDSDCIIGDREYYLYDTGLAVGAILLRATELGLVVHPIAGYNPSEVKTVLGIPDEYNVINLIIVGKKSEKIADYLNDRQIAVEEKRPPRLSLDELVHHNKYQDMEQKI